MFKDVDIFGGVTKYQIINFYLGLFTFLSMYFALMGYDFKKIKKYFRCLLFLLGLLSFFSMLLIGGRSSIISTIVVVGGSFLLSLKRSKDKKIIFISFFAIMILLIVLRTYIFETAAVKRFLPLLNFSSFDPISRILLYKKALELFSLNLKNLIFGAGINYFPVYINAYSCGFYPHNIFLELLAEYGVFGTILFLSPIFFILKVRKKRFGSIVGNSPEEELIFLLALYFWIVYMFTKGLRVSWELIFFTYLLMPGPVIDPNLAIERNESKKYDEV
jgi:O-antigen ligase